MLAWILLLVLLIAVFGLGTVLEVAVEVVLGLVLVVALIAVAGYLFLRGRSADRRS